MVAPLFGREALERSGFFATDMARTLAADPVGLIDVGARWGVDELFRAAAPLFRAVAFEPDPEEAERVRARETAADWAGCEIVVEALGARPGPATLHLLARPNNSSLYPVDPEVAKRYHLLGFEKTRDIPLELVPLDALVFDRFLGGARAGEVVKLDVQGAEPDVIEGARRTIGERTLCMICEVAFFAPYRGIKLFAEIELALRGLGLAFYGFLDFQHRSTRRLDKRIARGRERMMQADAVFFRDPLSAGAGRELAVRFLMALLLGYFDFCLELADAVGGAEGARLSEVARALARVDPKTEAEAVASLAQAAGDPARQHLAVSRLVDRRRDFATVHDLPDPNG